MRLSIAVWAGLVLTLSASGVLPPVKTAHAAAPVRITLDAGHGGSEVGASYRFADGVVLQEKMVNLQVVLALRGLLQQAGFAVTLTRSTDAPVNVNGQDLTGDSHVGLADELQARVDVANRAGSDLFVSVCFNGSSDPSIRGTETFWNPSRPFSDRNQQLSMHVQSGLVADLAAAGYATRDRGSRTDASLLNGDAFYLLGPLSSIIAHPSTMPAVIAEPLFLTNPGDASALRDSRILNAIAQGLFDGIEAYVGSTSTGPATVATQPLQREPVSTQTSHRWTVWAVTYTDTAAGRRLAVQATRSLAAHGLISDVLVTAHMARLLTGFLVVTSGTFGNREVAMARAAQVRLAGYPDAYARAVVV